MGKQLEWLVVYEQQIKELKAKIDILEKEWNSQIQF